MRLKWRAFLRFRPRILTLIVFFLAVAVITLANLSYDEPVAASTIPYRSYGWPLIWHRVVLSGHWMTGNLRVVGWYSSLPRLAANVAMWLALLAALATGCEWLLRRYRPRPRWSLRTLLAFVALVAAVCGWYAHARNRAAIQDPLVPAARSLRRAASLCRPVGAEMAGHLGNGSSSSPHRGGQRLVFGSPRAGHGATVPAACPRAELRHLVEFQVDELSATTARAWAACGSSRR